MTIDGYTLASWIVGLTILYGTVRLAHYLDNRKERP